MPVFTPTILDDTVNKLVQYLISWEKRGPSSFREFENNCFKDGGWIYHLEFGEYRQAREALKITDSDGYSSYCCLGIYGEKVLCKNIEDVRLPNGNEYLVGSYLDLAVQTLLSGMNDNEHFSFPMIAYVIKEAFKKLDEQTKADTTPNA